MKDVTLSRLLVGLLLLPLAMPALWAQDDEDEDVLQLSPFVVDVSQDDGYLANNSAFGTRLDTNIRDIPLAVESLTRQFIDDIGATNLKETLEFSAGITTTDFNLAGFAGSTNNNDFSPSRVANGRNDSSVVTIRGFTTGTYLRRNLRAGFQFDITVVGALTDVAGISRAEVARGPQALLYGVSFLGGVVNYVPKEPLYENRYSTRVSFGSDNFFRAEFDATGPLAEIGNGELAYRAVYAYEERDDWEFDFRNSESHFFLGQLAWQNDKTRLLAEYIRSDWFQQSPDSIVDFRGDDDILPLDEFGNVPLWYEENLGLGHGFNLSGSDPFEDQQTDTFVFSVTHEVFEGLNVSAITQIDNVEIERLYTSRGRWRLRGQARNAPDDFVLNYTNQFNGNSEEAGYQFQWNDDPFEAESIQSRIDISYQFDALGATHNFIAGWLYDEQKLERFSKHNNRGSWVNLNSSSPLSFSDYDDGHIEWRGYTDDTRYQDNLYLVYNSKWFEDRLNIVAGLNYNRYKVRSIPHNAIYVNDNGDRVNPNGNVTEAQFRGFEVNEALRNEGPGTDRPNRAPVVDFVRFGGDAPTETTPTIGASWRINDTFTVYAVSAGGLFPNPGQRDGRSQNFDAEKTQSYEIGMKFEAMEGKLSGEIAAYQIERENAIWFYSQAPAPRNNFDQLFSGSGRNNFDPTQPRTYAVRKDLVDNIQAGYVPFVNDGSGGNVNHDGGNDTYYLINYEELANNPVEAQALEAAFQEQFARLPGTSGPVPLDYNENFDLLGGGRLETNNPSESRGSDVSFTEESRGVELLLNYKATENLDLIFRGSVQEKEIKEGFALEPHIDPFRENQANLATEFDTWLLALGRENFTDVTDPSTFNGDILEGLSLSTEPDWQFSFISRYVFREGPLAGLNIRPGLIVTGPRPTTTAIGGGNATSNAFPTPDMPTFYDLRFGIGYRTELSEKVTMRLNFSVNNLLDENRVEEAVTYQGPDGPIRRNAFVYYRPLTFRFTCGFDF